MKRRARGIVQSNKPDKTITVRVENLRQHPRYKKYLRKRSTLTAHDAHNEANEGDLVEIEETRPLSKNKSWRLLRIIRRSAETEALPEEMSGMEA
ncbi:MAG: 30S ribosomal protein S17 [Candidatus Brocadiia bacterium]